MKYLGENRLERRQRHAVKAARCLDLPPTLVAQLEEPSSLYKFSQALKRAEALGKDYVDSNLFRQDQQAIRERKAYSHLKKVATIHLNDL